MAQSPSAHPLPTADALREAKRALRQRVLAARDSLAPEFRAAASAAISRALAGREDFATASTVLLTLPFGSEWDSMPLLLAALERGKTVALPRVNASARKLELCRLTEPSRDVLPGYRGIPEPQSHCALIAAGAIDWVLVPGVAFDTAGHRLGYGGGYYDRLLPQLRSDAARIAGGYEIQLVDFVPAASHDVPVQALATERRTLPMPG
ncbi:MAG TPA: 5-formyltetrahydrofolate cyclo-ligase [Casimicrobiaceae bacterium]|nr:5-formyltetrahydrofolate cyclo-ligase [Casimicrobiaceae bacterium]